MKCKSDRGKISWGILVLKVFVQSIWTLKGQNCPFFILKPAASARALARSPLLLWAHYINLTFSFFILRGQDIKKVWGGSDPRCAFKSGFENFDPPDPKNAKNLNFYLITDYGLRKELQNPSLRFNETFSEIFSTCPATFVWTTLFDKYAMGWEIYPQKTKKTAKIHKIQFWAQTGGPSGFVMKCKSDRRKISHKILVF